MARNPLSEAVVEDAALAWFESCGYAYRPGARIAPGEPEAEREAYTDVLLTRRVRDAIDRLNPDLPPEAREDAFRKLARPAGAGLILDNRAFHEMLVGGVEVEFRRDDGRIVGDRARLVDYEDPRANDWLVVNQFTVEEGRKRRRADVVVFVNGLPVAVVELKSAAAPGATLWSAFNQLQEYKDAVPTLFVPNGLLVVSDGREARVGSLTADRDRFMPWRTIDGRGVSSSALELEVLIRGLFEPKRLLAYLRDFVVFEDTDAGLAKKIAGHHQFHAVLAAVDETVRAARPGGDRRCGVVWHTQGSGKSLTMAFFAGRIVREPAMRNPTVVVLTDRNDLDDQLFGTFSRCKALVRQAPVQAADRADLRDLLRVASGGVVFTTVQKFFPDENEAKFPTLSDRENVVVIADEAHRSQYDFVDGFARHMRDALPNASFIAFTGTPISLADRDTRSVFGEYIHTYDVRQAIDDRATVPIYYEGRLVRLELSDADRARLDAAFADLTAGEEDATLERLKREGTNIEQIVGSERRLALVAEDLVAHWEARRATQPGKAMIVCMSRRICVALYDALVRLRPDWHDADDARGKLKVVMTGSPSDPPALRAHHRSKAERKVLGERFKKAADPFRIAIVCDMWLTGFDVPCLDTMYLDKPLSGHNLMQAIARVNRRWGDKPGGLIVDYLGIAAELKKAIATYTEAGGTGDAVLDKDAAVAAMREKFEIVRDMLHGFNWSAWTAGDAAARLRVVHAAEDFVLNLEDGKARFARAVRDLSKAFALAVPHEATERIVDDLAFFQAVARRLRTFSAAEEQGRDDMDFAVRRLVAEAIAPTEVVDIFTAAGLDRPNISILSDEFLAEVRGMEHRNLALELLKKLLNDEIKERAQTNVVRARAFSEMLDRALRAYRNRALTTAQVIEELIGLAKDMRAAQERDAALGLTSAEIAFYDALADNESAVQVLGDATLRELARKLVEKVRGSATIDWTERETVRARLRVEVRRLLRKYGYPPDMQERATQTVLEQAERVCADWAN